MYKTKSRKKDDDLSKRYVFWNQVVEDIERKLKDARRRVSDLECAHRIFNQNAKKGAPIPAGDATAVQVGLHENHRQHSV